MTTLKEPITTAPTDGGDYSIMLERISTGEISLNMIMRSKLPL
jgi:hypothetical protein